MRRCLLRRRRRSGFGVVDRAAVGGFGKLPIAGSTLVYSRKLSKAHTAPIGLRSGGSLCLSILAPIVNRQLDIRIFPLLFDFGVLKLCGGLRDQAQIVSPSSFGR